MKSHELEAKVLGIIDRVQRNQPVEDSLVELKADWIEPKKAGRRIAGLCNAARGEPVLWIVGVDEERGVVGASLEELSNWWSAVRAEFDQGEPAFVQNLSIPAGDLTVVALLIDTSRAPYVTKNPVGGGPVGLEVPWREGNSTRSARREDLIRILVPATKIPQLDFLSARAASWRDDDTRLWKMKLEVDLYVHARVPTTIIAHQSAVNIDPPQLGFGASGYGRSFVGHSAEGIAVSADDVVLSRPGKFRFMAFGMMAGIGPVLPPSASVTVELAIAEAAQRLVITFTMLQVSQATDKVQYKGSGVG